MTSVQVFDGDGEEPRYVTALRMRIAELENALVQQIRDLEQAYKDRINLAHQSLARSAELNVHAIVLRQELQDLKTRINKSQFGPEIIYLHEDGLPSTGLIDATTEAYRYAKARERWYGVCKRLELDPILAVSQKGQLQMPAQLT